MTKDQISDNSVVSIEVIDKPSLNFYFDTQTSQTTNSVDSPACTIKMNEVSFNRIFDGYSTFEQEVQNGYLKVEGNHQLLRQFGQLVRANSQKD
jgi:hypothetical protein